MPARDGDANSGLTARGSDAAQSNRMGSPMGEQAGRPTRFTLEPKRTVLMIDDTKVGGLFDRVAGIFENFYTNVLLRILERTITDSEGLRDFIRRQIATLDALADRTAMQFDDKLVEALAYVVNSNDAWNWFYEVLFDLYQKIVVSDLPCAVDVDTLVKQAEEDAKLDPVLIAVLIDAAISLFQLWRERRQ